MATSPMLVIVDDSILIRKLIAAYLKAEAPAYTVHVCRNGADALAYLSEGGVAGIIVDHMLPDTDGITLAHTITTRWPTLPVVLFTDFLSSNLNAAARTAGCVAALEKPYGLFELWPTLQSVLSPISA